MRIRKGFVCRSATPGRPRMILPAESGNSARPTVVKQLQRDSRRRPNFLISQSPNLLISILIILAFLTGCVERTLILRSDPSGATVVVNGDEVGVAPAKLHFESYGTFEVVMSAPRYRRLRALVPVQPPWYERIPFDLFAEAAWPWTIHDEHPVTLKLEPLGEAETVGAGLDEREKELQKRVLEGGAAPQTP